MTYDPVNESIMDPLAQLYKIIVLKSGKTWIEVGAASVRDSKIKLVGPFDNVVAALGWLDDTIVDSMHP